MTNRRVTIETRTVGSKFGWVGIVRDAATGQTLHETAMIRPYDMPWVAERDAEAYVATRRWRLVSDSLYRGE